MISERRYRRSRLMPSGPHILCRLTLKRRLKRLPRRRGVFQAIFHARMPRSWWSHGLWFMT